jgi:hypothetical protein
VSAVDDTRRLVEAFRAAQARHDATGADDTEPSAVFSRLVRKAWRDRGPAPIPVPDTWERWHLYSPAADGEDGPAAALVAAAVRDLTAAAAAVAAHLHALPARATMAEGEAVREYLCGYVWED